MQAGKLTETITIVEPSEIQNEFGELVTSYTTVVNTRAAKKYSQGYRTTDNDELFNNYQITFTIRSYHNLNEKMVVIHKDNRYRIVSIDDTNKDKIILNCELINE